MPRYEVVSDATRKFWEVAQDGATFTVTAGLVGTKGERRTFSYPTPEKAAKALEQLVQSKRALGYVLVETPSAANGAGLWHAANPQLESTVLADRDADAPWQVYADWLQSQGDVRGELFARARDAKGFAKYVEAHLDALFGDVVPHLEKRRPEVELEWRRGFVDALLLRANDYEGDTRLTELARKALALPVTVFLRELTLRIGVYQQGQDFTGALEALRDSERGAIVETLSLAHDPADRDDDWQREVEWPAWGSLAPLSGAPRLELLSVEGTHGEVGRLELPSLKKLTLVGHALTATNLEDLRRSALPKLEKLALEPRALVLGVGEALSALCSGEALPALKQLSIERAPALHEALPALVHGTLLPRLTRLSLKHSELTDADVSLLLGQRKRFAHLKGLSLPAGYATTARADELKTLCARVSLAKPRRAVPGDDDFYEGVME